MPEDREALLSYAATVPGALFIAKPRRGTGGQNMAISRDVRRARRSPDVVVQRYVENPYLVDGRKGHVRLHGVVTSLDPFRAYMQSEGIVRFAPKTYDTSDAGLADVHAHITNTALHKDHPKLVVSQKAEEENVGAVWSLTAYLERLKCRRRRRGCAAGRAEGADAGVSPHGARRGRLRRPGQISASLLPREAVRPRCADRRRRQTLADRGATQASDGRYAARAKIAGKALTTIFEMGAGFMFDDGRRPSASPVLRKTGPLWSSGRRSTKPRSRVRSNRCDRWANWRLLS